MRRLPFHGLTEAPRSSAVRSTIGRRAVLFTQNDQQDLEVNPASMASGYNTDAVIELMTDCIVWNADEVSERRRGFRAVYRPDRLEYRENGLIDVTGNSLQPGLQWYLPGRENGLFYTSQTFACTDEILGVPVTGFLFIEQAYMQPESVLYAVNDVLVGAETHLPGNRDRGGSGRTDHSVLHHQCQSCAGRRRLV